MRAFLLPWILMVAALSVVSVSVPACGGKVAVERDVGGGGAGGAGATTGSNTSASTNSGLPSGGADVSTGSVVASSGADVGSSGSGEQCGCDQVCATLKACKAPGSDQCDQFCNFLPQDQQQCVCDLPPSCQGLGDCFGFGMGPGGGPGSGGGPGPGSCKNCTDNLPDGACDAESSACQGNDECVAILDCHNQCGWAGFCQQQCDGQHPDGAAEFSALVNCVVCANCFDECSKTPIVKQYCADSGG